MSKQSSVDFILNAFNLLSDSDFKAWMLNNYDEVKAMHKEEIIEAWKDGEGHLDNDSQEEAEWHYYKTYGDGM